MPSRDDAHRSKVEQARLRQQAAAAGGPRTLAEAAAVAAARPTSAPRWPDTTIVAVATVAAAGLLYLAGPLRPVMAGHGPLVLSTVVLVGAAAAGWHRRHLQPPLFWRRSLGAAVAVLALFAVGMHSSVTVDGRVPLATSDQAQAVEFIRRLEGDLRTIAAHDPLLAADTAQARSQIDAYRPAADQLAATAGRYAIMQVDDLPSEAFLPIVRDLVTAADFGSRALLDKRDLTLQYDARLEQQVQSYRQTYVESVLGAGPKLADLARLYGFELVDPETEPVE